MSTAIIIGAENSISGALAERYRREFDKVYISDIQSSRASNDAERHGITAVPLNINVLNESDVTRLFDYADYDHVAVCVGGGSFNLLSATSAIDLVRAFELNCVSAHNILRNFHSSLVITKKKGDAVLVSSINSINIEKGLGGYSVGKAALECLAKSSAIEYAPYMRVNCVRPGPISGKDSELAALLKQESTKFNLLGDRLTLPVDVAAASVCFHKHLTWVTGESLTVDGGLLLGNGS